MSVRPSGPARSSMGIRTGGRYTDTASSAVMSLAEQVGSRDVNVCQDTDVARFLFVIVPIVARVWPAVAIGDALAAMGHDVAWCGPESDLRPLDRPGPGDLSDRQALLPRVPRGGHGRGAGAVGRVPGAAQPVHPGPVDHAVAEYRPDVVVADQYALAGDPGGGQARGAVGAPVRRRPRAHSAGRVPRACGSGSGSDWRGCARPPACPRTTSLDLLFSPYLVIVDDVAGADRRRRPCPNSAC